jgi:hypothetical protein
MTVVLPAPVASFSASRASSGLASALALARCSRKPLPVLPSLGATSVSQIAVSTASIWQKNGRTHLENYGVSNVGEDGLSRVLPANRSGSAGDATDPPAAVDR